MRPVQGFVGAEVTAPPEALVVRDLLGPGEMRDCERLYAEVMGLRPEDGSINPRLLVALQHNGGYALGAFAGDELVGFAYSFLGCDRSGPGRGELYQYSQLAVVARPMQGQGVGRRLKYAQRGRCLADGVRSIRWAYDPVKTRNAHFNLDVLGGEVTAWVGSMYGREGFGADRAEDTDRFIVTWDLSRTGRLPQPSMPSRVGERTWPVGLVRAEGDDLLIALPARWESFRQGEGQAAARDLRARLGAVWSEALDSGRVGVSCQAVDTDVALYRFAPATATAPRGAVDGRVVDGDGG